MPDALSGSVHDFRTTTTVPARSMLLKCVAMLMLHHKGELEAAVPQRDEAPRLQSKDLLLLFECFC